jgi:D-xylonolactonase
MGLNMPTIQTVWTPTLQLGEGPLWHAASQRFFFVDIHGCALHAWAPDTDKRQSWPLPERICWLVPRADGDGFVAGLQSGFFRLWTEPVLRWEALGSPHPGEPGIRLNDAKADCHGRIWAGSMHNANPGLRQGRLARLEPAGGVTVVERDIHIANGPAIAHDGSWMLHTDSFINTVYRYDLLANGDLSNKAEWKTFTDDEGTPDGMTLDRDGMVWVAFWGGACIRQFTPEGVLLQTIALPATQITSMAFGGKDLDLLLVTSARVGLDAETLTRHPLAGSAFLLTPGVQGVLPCTYG